MSVILKRSVGFVRLWSREVPRRAHHARMYFHHVYFPPATPSLQKGSSGRFRNFATPTSFDDKSYHIEADSRTHEQYPSGLLERTRYLLDPANQLDGTDPNLWIEADHILQAWLDQDFALDFTPLRRVDSCLRILDRLSNTLPEGEMLFIPLLNQDILNQVFKTWRAGLDSPPTHDSNLKSLLTPSFLSTKIDKYSRTSLLHPGFRTYNLLLRAAPMFPFRDGIRFSDGLLHRLVHITRENSTKEMPPLMDVVSVATVMRNWVNQNQPEKAEDWLQRLESWQGCEDSSHLGQIRPNRVVYTTVISGWAKVGKAEKALDVLDRQIRSFNDGNHDCRPDTATFNCIFDALSKSKHPTGRESDIAQQLLAQMHDFGVNPDAFTWTSLMSCWVRHKPSEAEKLLRQLEKEVDPIPVSVYNAMLSGYAQSGNVKTALSLLRKMEVSSQCRPDIVTYNIVLSAYVRLKSADAAQQAELLFCRIQDQEGIIPTLTTYSTLMQCWSKSKELDGATHAEDILWRMEAMGLAPNTACYNIALSAWADQASVGERESKSASIDRMLHVYGAMTTSATARPNEVTFRALMYAVVGMPSSKKMEMLDFLSSEMKRFRYVPRGKDEQLYRRCFHIRGQGDVGGRPPDSSQRKATNPRSPRVL